MVFKKDLIKLKRIQDTHNTYFLPHYVCCFLISLFQKVYEYIQSSFVIFTSRIMHLVCPNKILNYCITPVNVFFFSLDDCNTQKKLKTKVQYIMAADK